MAQRYIVKNGDAICVTDTNTRGTKACNKDLCEEGYDSDDDIGPYFATILY